MKQITAGQTVYRTATLFLKKENVGNEQDSVSIIENSKNLSYTVMSDKFAQVFTKDNHFKKYEAPDNEDWYEGNIVCDKFVGDHNETRDSSKVYGTEMRGFAVGDIVQIQEWSYNEKAMGIQGSVNRFFMIGKNEIHDGNIMRS